ncbi:MAG: replication factor C small subunit, partial [Candidatus Diapherotrites archaeon]|nr:replication factor C small subunit [Candidatus Diapherotrites archaeon]
EQEKLKIDQKALDALIYVASGDVRKAINVLQAASTTAEKISEENVYSVASKARPQEVREIILSALKGDFMKAREQLHVLLYDHGMSGEDVISQLYSELMNLTDNEIDAKIKIELVDKIGEYDFRIVEGASERIQLEALLAQFGKHKL